MTTLDEFYKVGPGPSSSHTIGPMRITYDFYQRCTKLSPDQLAKSTALQSALASGAGYVAALGSRHMQALRAQWLTENGVSAADQQRIHGPAGLDIGARTPAEMAVAVVGEMVAVRAGASGGLLSRRDGPIHP